MSYNWRKRQIIFLIIILILIIWYNDAPERKKRLVSFNGSTMGTTYSVKYLQNSGSDFQTSIDSLLLVFNQSLSTYIPGSEISQFNNDTAFSFRLPFFKPVLQKSKEVYELSNYTFDPTVGPLVNSWGFGFLEQEDIPDSVQIDSLLKFVGFSKVHFDESSVYKTKEMILDFSAIAKGYGVDAIADFLESKNIQDFFVEIGGEVRCKGLSDKNELWKIGITVPDEKNITNEIEAIVLLQNQAMATSGNYRNYYEKDGKRYAHTISPKTGFPVQHNLLSASVVANDCMTADAWATAFMVMGVEEAKKVLKKENLEAYLIYNVEGNKTKSFITEGLKNQLIKNY